LPLIARAVENSIWAVAFVVVGIGLCRLLPEFNGPVRVVLVIAITGIAVYLAFLVTVDVPIYLSRSQEPVAGWSSDVSAVVGKQQPVARHGV
jgi:hypothetical protein